MTSKQLESIIVFMDAYNRDFSDTEIQERFGVENVSDLGQEAALYAFLKVKNIKLEDQPIK